MHPATLSAPPVASSLADVETTLSFVNLPGGIEWIVLLVIGLLIFGRRLPDVGRSLGRGIVEFKRGIKGIEDEIDEESSRSSSPSARIEERPSTAPPTHSMSDAQHAEPGVNTQGS